MQYRKFPKYLDTQNICCNHSKIWTMWLYHRVMNESKRCRRNGKQCRAWSDCSSRISLIWVCTVCPGISVQKLRIITVIIHYVKLAKSPAKSLGLTTFVIDIRLFKIIQLITLSMICKAHFKIFWDQTSKVTTDYWFVPVFQLADSRSWFDSWPWMIRRFQVIVNSISLISGWLRNDYIETLIWVQLSMWSLLIIVHRDIDLSSA